MTSPTIVNIAGADPGPTITKPASGTTGDYYVVHAYSESTTAVTHAVSGFTSSGTSRATGAGDTCFSTHWKAYTGTEAASFTLTGFTTGVYTQMVAYIVRGADTGGPNVMALPTGDILDHIVYSSATVPAGDSLAILAHFQFAFIGRVPTITATGSWTNDISQAGNTGDVWHNTYSGSGGTGSFTVQKYDTASSASASGGHFIIWAAPLPPSPSGNLATEVNAILLDERGRGLVTEH